jgi:methylenetetrahydrofolate--tRNA-(uracil-5-)-methyltransferase
VVQLRAENAGCSAYNLVGFQTNLAFGEQQRVFRMIPGLEQAEFVRYGVMHRNTFIDSPRALDAGFALPADTNVRFAGQITGTEGYVEAIASGMLAALNTYARLGGLEPVILPPTTVFGALVAYATSAETVNYQPMHVNFGIMPALERPPKGKKERHAAYAARANAAIDAFVTGNPGLDFRPRFTVPFLDEG